MNDQNYDATQADDQTELDEQALESVAGGAETPWNEWGNSGEGEEGSADWWNPNTGG